jgi:hypothetical protein
MALGLWVRAWLSLDKSDECAGLCLGIRDIKVRDHRVQANKMTMVGPRGADHLPTSGNEFGRAFRDTASGSGPSVCVCPADWGLSRTHWRKRCWR